MVQIIGNSKIMIKKIKLMVIFIASLVLVNCAGYKAFIPLSKEVKQQITSSNLVLVNNQQELNAEILESNATSVMGGGILVALVDSAVNNSRAKTAERLIMPIRSELVDFSMDQEIKKALLPVVKSTVWLHANDISIINGIYKDVVDKLLKDKNNNKDIVGVFNLYYALDHSFTTLKVTLGLELYPLKLHINENKQEKTKKIQPIYRAKIEYNKNINMATGSAEKNAKLWAANNGEAIKSALKDAVLNVTLQLTDNLKDPSVELDKKKCSQ